MTGISRRSLRSVAGLLLLMGATLGTNFVPSQAGATAWNPTVTLQGTSVCAGRGTTWVWVQASNGERGWATNGTGRYRFTFRRVPTSGMTVTVNYGNSTFSCRDAFGLNRPTVGTSATRNVYKLWPNA